LARGVKKDMDTEAPTTARRVLRMTAFGISSAAGFLVAEGVIVAGLYAIFGKLEVPGNMSSSPTLVALDVFALVVGVVVSFALNERTTVSDSKGKEDGIGAMLVRLGRFEGISALGNAVVIVVQLALLAEFGLTPAVGSVVGAIVGFPVSYLMSMRLVWRIRA
jgi:putative flippase GtrA